MRGGRSSGAKVFGPLPRYGLSGLLMVAATLQPAAAVAATSASFAVVAEVISGCEINGALPDGGQPVGDLGTLAFGTYSALKQGVVSTSLAWNSNVHLRCTPGVSLTMSVDGGLHPGTTRNMQAATSSARISYQLYQDVGLTVALPADQPVAVPVEDTEGMYLPIHGAALLTGDQLPDTYSDTLTITLNW